MKAQTPLALVALSSAWLASASAAAQPAPAAPPAPPAEPTDAAPADEAAPAEPAPAAPAPGELAPTEPAPAAAPAPRAEPAPASAPAAAPSATVASPAPAAAPATPTSPPKENGELDKALASQSMLTEFAVLASWSRDDTLQSGAPGPTFAAAIGPYFGPIWAHVRLGYSTFAHEADRLSYVDATVGATPVLVPYEPVILRIGGDVGVSYGSAVVSLDQQGNVDPDKSRASRMNPLVGAQASIGWAFAPEQPTPNSRAHNALELETLANLYAASCLGKSEPTCRALRDKINQLIAHPDKTCTDPKPLPEELDKITEVDLAQLRSGARCWRSTSGVRPFSTFNLLLRMQWSIDNADGWKSYHLGLSVVF